MYTIQLYIISLYPYIYIYTVYIYIYINTSIKHTFSFPVFLIVVWLIRSNNLIHIRRINENLVSL